ncbi:MAG: NlpC/P60 family protein [Pseudomonadota bacterium]
MKKAVICKSIASLNLNPCLDSEMADEVLHGMVVEILESKDDPWMKIRTSYDYVGYVHKNDMILDDDAASAWENEKYIVWYLLADVMSGPNYQSSVIATLVRGCVIKYTGVFEGKWEQVGLADGSFGWIRKGFCRFVERLSTRTDEERLRANIVSAAMDYLGTQYRWGGKSHFGIDCSGLAGMAYMVNGYVIPRDGGPQEKYLKPIKREDIKPADLIFFPGHVALYIGDGKYVHSTGREGYTLVNSLDKDSAVYREDLDKGITSICTLFGIDFSQVR